MYLFRGRSKEIGSSYVKIDVLSNYHQKVRDGFKALEKNMLM